MMAACEHAFYGPSWGLTHRNVKNEDRTGYVHENTGDDDKMSSKIHSIYPKIRQLRDDRQDSIRLLRRNAQIMR